MGSYYVWEPVLLGLLLLIPSAICIYPAVRLNRKMLAKFPGRQPFGWGDYNALIAIPCIDGLCRLDLLFWGYRPGARDDLEKGIPPDIRRS